MLPDFYALLIGIVMIVLTVFIHYEALTTRWPIRRQLTSVRIGMLRLLIAIFVAHIFEIILYAIAIYLMHGHFGLGTIAGKMSGQPTDYFYFSVSSYTTLGFGDVYPSGPIRVIAGIESLNGLVLIGWSTSYTYLAMLRFSRSARRWAGDEQPPHHFL